VIRPVEAASAATPKYQRATATFVVRQGSATGPYVPGAVVELYWRQIAGAGIAKLASATANEQGVAEMNVVLEPAQQAGGEFAAIVHHAGLSQNQMIVGHPADYGWKLQVYALSVPATSEVKKSTVDVDALLRSTGGSSHAATDALSGVWRTANGEVWNVTDRGEMLDVQYSDTAQGLRIFGTLARTGQNSWSGKINVTLHLGGMYFNRNVDLALNRKSNRIYAVRQGVKRNRHTGQIVVAGSVEDCWYRSR